MNASDFTKTDTTMNKLQNVSGTGRKPDHRLIKLSNLNVSHGLNQHQSTSSRLQNFILKVGGGGIERYYRTTKTKVQRMLLIFRMFMWSNHLMINSEVVAFFLQKEFN